MGREVWESEACGGNIFRTRPYKAWDPYNLLYKWYRVSFPGVKCPGHDVCHTPQSSAEVKIRAALYLYPPSWSSWPVIEWPVRLLDRDECPAARPNRFTLRKEPIISSGQQTGWVPQPNWSLLECSKTSLLTRIEPRFLDLPVRSLVPTPTTLYRFLWGRNWIVKCYIHQSCNTKKHYHTMTSKTLSYTNTKNTNICKHQKHYHTLIWNSTSILLHQHQKHYHTLTPKTPSYANTKKHCHTLTRKNTITN